MIFKKVALMAVLALLGLYAFNAKEESNAAIEQTDAFLYDNCKKTNAAIAAIGREVEDCETKYLN